MTKKAPHQVFSGGLRANFDELPRETRHASAGVVPVAVALLAASAVGKIGVLMAVRTRGPCRRRRRHGKTQILCVAVLRCEADGQRH